MTLINYLGILAFVHGQMDGTCFGNGAKEFYHSFIHNVQVSLLM